MRRRKKKVTEGQDTKLFQCKIVFMTEGNKSSREALNQAFKLLRKTETQSFSDQPSFNFIDLLKHLNSVLSRYERINAVKSQRSRVESRESEYNLINRFKYA